MENIESKVNETMWSQVRDGAWKRVESMVTTDVWNQTAVGTMRNVVRIAKEGVVQNIALDIRSHMDSLSDQ